MDIAAGARDTGAVRKPGRVRERLARILNGAFAEGLLSEQTLTHRLGVLFGARLLDPSGLVGDLDPPRGRRTIRIRARARRSWSGAEPAPLVLSLEWDPPDEAGLLIGRSAVCDVVVDEPTVSRRHARLRFHDGTWMIQVLGSTNGTSANRVPVGRAALHPGDRVRLGLQPIEID